MAHNYVVHSTQSAGGVLVLTLVPKTRQDRMTFSAGQYAAIGFMRDGRPTPMRCFSMTSSPGSGVLQFAMRVQGKFTRAAAELQSGDTVWVQGPFGEFVINEEYDQKLVLLAGGIGVAPFMSIVRDITERSLPIRITVLFANRSAANIPFYDELVMLERQNRNVRIAFYADDAGVGSQRIVAGGITDQDIRQLLRGAYAGSTYFICGPGGFSDRMRTWLLAGGVHESRVVSETFAQASVWTPGSGLNVRALTYGLAFTALVVMTGAVMTVDLVHAVPKLSSAQSADQGQTSTSQDDIDSGDNDGSADNINSDGSSTTTAPTQTYQQPMRRTYQPPMSSVS